MKKKESIHHRHPRSLGGDSRRVNISLVAEEAHRAWHRLFQNYPPEEIARIINETWLDYRYTFVVRKKKGV